MFGKTCLEKGCVATNTLNVSAPFRYVLHMDLQSDSFDVWPRDPVAGLFVCDRFHPGISRTVTLQVLVYIVFKCSP